MKRQRNNYYVGVCTLDNHLKLVYRLDFDTKMAYWDTLDEIQKKGLTPIQMSKKLAEQYANLLRWNNNEAFVIATPRKYGD